MGITKYSSSLLFKIAAPLVAAFIIGFAFAGTFIVRALSDSRALSASVRHLTLLKAASELGHSMQMERAYSQLLMDGKISSQELEKYRSATDEASLRLNAALPGSGIPQDVAEKAASAVENFTATRKWVTADGQAAIPSNMFNLSIASVLAVEPAIGYLEAGKEFGSALSSIIILEEAKEAAVQIRSRVSAIGTADKPVPLQDATTLLDLSAKLTANIDSAAIALPKYTEGVASIRDSQARRLATGSIWNIFARYTTGGFDIETASFFEKMTGLIDSVYQVIQGETEFQLERAKRRDLATRLFFILSAVSIAVGYTLITILAYKTAAGIMKSAKTMSAALKEIAEGGGDLTRRIPVLAKDELGELAGHFNAFQTELAALVNEVKSNAADLADVGADLSSTMEETASAAVQISANVESVKKRTIDQSAGATESSATVERIVENLRTLNGAIARQGESVANSSASIEQMVANVMSVTRNVERMGDEYLKLVKSAESGRTVLDKTVAEVQNISERSERLRDANALIASIAAQTNLLAMNAAIEAAHAGSAGLGFAVVADEIRKLAENASKQSKAIAVDVREISGAISDVVTSSQETASSFGEVVTQIEQLHALEEEIKLSMTEQSAGSAQVLDSLNLINEVTAEVTRGAKEMGEGSEAVLGEMRRLLDASVEIEHSMSEIAAGAAEVSQASTAAADLTVKNRDGIAAVSDRMGRFKV